MSSSSSALHLLLHTARQRRCWDVSLRLRRLYPYSCSLLQRRPDLAEGSLILLRTSLENSHPASGKRGSPFISELRDPQQQQLYLSPSQLRFSSFPSTAPSSPAFFSSRSISPTEILSSRSLTLLEYLSSKILRSFAHQFLLSFHHGQKLPLPPVHIFDGLMEFLVRLRLLCSHHRMLFRVCHQRRLLSFHCHKSSAPIVITRAPG